MRRIAIVHFSPIELYPPVQNLINELQEAPDVDKVIILTHVNTVNNLSRFESRKNSFKIIRFRNFFRGMGQISRLLNYSLFYCFCIYNLLRHSPGVVMYYETLSSFPVYLYKKFFKRNAAVLIHYHEYTSLPEYETGMRMVRWFYQLEQWIYPRAMWISHTNATRLKLFLADIRPLKIHNAFVYPNYPPRSWFREPRPILHLPVRVVYVGALSLTTMYTREFAEWVMEQDGKIIWDIYSYNCGTDAREYINNLNSPWIKLKMGIDYHELPCVLKDYDVGVILYRGHIPNYIHNAPNKLFEYLACGLSVWFPEIMTECKQYISQGTVPEVRVLDFTCLTRYQAKQFINEKHYPYRNQSFDSGSASRPLLDHLLK